MADPVYEIPDLDEDDAQAAPVLLDRSQHGRAVAEYVGDMLEELESMSRRAGFELLVYLISMARAEAEAKARAS